MPAYFCLWLAYKSGHFIHVGKYSEIKKEEAKMEKEVDSVETGTYMHMWSKSMHS